MKHVNFQYRNNLLGILLVIETSSQTSVEGKTTVRLRMYGNFGLIPFGSRLRTFAAEFLDLTVVSFAAKNHTHDHMLFGSRGLL